MSAKQKFARRRSFRAIRDFSNEDERGPATNASRACTGATLSEPHPVGTVDGRGISKNVYRAPCGGRGKEEPLSVIAMVLQAAPGDDDLPPPGPPRHTSAA